MLVVKEKDYLEVNLNSLVADYDREILINLYQPIIGYKAVGLYFSLLTEVENQKINSIISHQVFFLKTQMNAGEFVDNRKLLEAVGLLKTFVSDLKENKLYQYELYAPKTPKLFFDNTLLYGMLIKSIGEVEAGKLKNIYSLNRQPEGKEITASFIEVFAPDFDDPAFRKAMESSGNVVSRQSAKLNSGFNYELFFEYLSQISQINGEAFTKKMIKEIERLATLYGISEESAAQTVAQLYNPRASKEERIDFNELANRFMEETNYIYLTNHRGTRLDGSVSGNNDLAHKINLMEKLTPKQFLMVLQNGTVPALSDLKLINDISSKFKLPNCVINALIDYVLTVNDNVLSKAFAEKVAGSLAREGIQTTVDAMNYLKRVFSKGRKKSERREPPKEPVTPVEEQPSETLDWDAMIRDLEEDDDNGEN